MPAQFTVNGDMTESLVAEMSASELVAKLEEAAGAPQFVTVRARRRRSG